MYKFFRKYQKQTMAFFMAILMIAFIVPTTFRGTQGGEDQIVGHIGSNKIYRNNIRDVQDQWDLLANIVVRARPNGQEQWEPLLAVMLPQEFIESMKTKPEQYYLLLAEAKKMGFSPSDKNVQKNVEDELTNPNFGIRMGDGSVVSYDNIPSEDMRNNIKYSLCNLMIINRAFGNVIAAVKISQPLVHHEVSELTQKVKVRIVDFAGKDYESKVPAPTAEQLQQQFDRFSDYESGVQPSDANPFAFGYKYPNRVKLQYITIRRAEVRKAIQAAKDDYSWEVDANRYYFNHQDQFPTTQPTHSEQFSFTSPTTQPTTRPFSEVRQQIISDLIEPQVDKLQRQIAVELNTRLDQDYDAYHKNPPTTLPAYENFDYLKTLAAEIQSRFHVTITVASIADSFKTAKDLRALPGIGQVNALPDYVTTYFEAFVPAEQRDSKEVLHAFQFAKPQLDHAGGDVYFFRITAAEPGHKPANLADVKDQVTADWKRQQAYDLAKADAQKFFDSTRSVGLSSADHNVITTGAFQLSATTPIENYPLTNRSQFTFVRDAFNLLGQLSSDPAHKPIALIELPGDWKLAVAELIAVESQIKPDQLPLAESQATQDILQQYAVGMARSWFDYNNIVQRVNYQDDLHHATQ